MNNERGTRNDLNTRCAADSRLEFGCIAVRVDLDSEGAKRHLSSAASPRPNGPLSVTGRAMSEDHSWPLGEAELSPVPQTLPAEPEVRSQARIGSVWMAGPVQTIAIRGWVERGQ